MGPGLDVPLGLGPALGLGLGAGSWTCSGMSPELGRSSGVGTGMALKPVHGLAQDPLLEWVQGWALGWTLCVELAPVCCLGLELRRSGCVEQGPALCPLQVLEGA